MEKGYPAVVPNMKEEEYNSLALTMLKTAEIQGLKELLKKEVLEHFDLMIQLTAY